MIALGNFDGVHRGHQALVARAQQQAQALDAPLVALTFEPHPRRYFVPDTGPFRLTLPSAKVRLLAECGVQAVLAQRFDPAFAAISAQAFVRDGYEATLEVAAHYLREGAHHVILVMRADQGPEGLKRLAHEVAEPLREQFG